DLAGGDPHRSAAAAAIAVQAVSAQGAVDDHGGRLDAHRAAAGHAAVVRRSAAAAPLHRLLDAAVGRADRLAEAAALADVASTRLVARRRGARIGAVGRIAVTADVDDALDGYRAGGDDAQRVGGAVLRQDGAAADGEV